MGWLTPWALGLLALALPLTALYFRRRARQSRTVSSLELWRAVRAELPQATGLRRLRLDAPYFLHLAALALLAFALAGPVMRARIAPAARLVLVVDTTASMATRDPAGTRLDAARHAARRTLDALPRGAEVGLVRAGCTPRMVAAPSTDHDAVAAALDALRPDHCGGDLTRALTLATDRLRSTAASRRVMVLTDGVTRADALPMDLPVPVEVVRVGRPVANVGIVDFEAREDPAADPAGPRRLAVFVGLLAAHLEGPRDATLTLERLVGDRAEPVAVRALRLTAGRSAATLPVALAPDDSTDLLRATLRLDGGSGDGQPLDDVAWAPVPTAAVLPVRLVAAAPGPSPWIVRALRADRSLRVETLTPAAWATRPDPRFAGLTVLHGALPAEMPAGTTLAFLRGDLAALRNARAVGFALDAVATAPRWTDTTPSDARVRFVGVADVHVGAARPVTLDPGVVALVTSTAGPLVAARDTAQGSATLVGFDPDASDWPLRPGFVFFLRGATEHARMRRQALALEARRTGTVLRIAGRGSETVRVWSTGYAQTLPVHAGVAVWGDTTRTGVFSLARGAATERVGLSLLDPVESALSPSDLPWRGAEVRPVEAPRVALRGLAPWLAAAALAAMLAEWMAWPRAPRRPGRVRGVLAK